MREAIINYLILKGYIPEKDKEIYNYGLYVLVLNIVGNGSVLFFSYVFEELLFGLIFLLFFSSLRIVWGGMHAKTPFGCFLSSNIVFLINLYLYCSYALPYLTFFNILLIISVWRIPSLNTRNNHVFEVNEKRKKIVCILFLLTLFNQFTSKITFLALSTNFVLHLFEVMRNYILRLQLLCKEQIE